MTYLTADEMNWCIRMVNDKKTPKDYPKYKMTDKQNEFYENLLKEKEKTLKDIGSFYGFAMVEKETNW